MQDAGAPNSPLRKALASLLGLLGPKDQELIRESLFDWPDEDSSISNVGAGNLPPCLDKYFESMPSAHRALEMYLNGRGKSCVHDDAGSGGRVSTYHCPYRHDKDAAGNKITDIRCPFFARVRFRTKEQAWQFEKETAVLDHDAHKCSSAHMSPAWMLREHPVFREDAAKPVKDRMKARDLITKLGEKRSVATDHHGQRIRVNKDIIKRARSRWETDLVEGFQGSLQRIPDWLCRFKDANPTAATAIERDGERFLRCLVIGPYMNIIVRHLCFRVFGVDGATLHDEWSKLKILQVTTRDGNFQVLPVAVALIPAESAQHVAWVLQRVQQHFAEVLELNAPEVVWISDRGSGLLGAIDTVFPHSAKFHCFRHIMDNLRARCSRFDPATSKACWKLQKSTSQRTWERNLASLRDINRQASEILEGLTSETWCNFKAREAGMALQGACTNNLVEVENARQTNLGIRGAQPLDYLDGVAFLWSTQMSRIHNLCQGMAERGDHLTPGEQGVWVGEGVGGGRWMHMSGVSQSMPDPAGCLDWSQVGSRSGCAMLKLGLGCTWRDCSSRAWSHREPLLSRTQMMWQSRNVL